ncbi:MAG: hypothetical protein JXM69_16770 [Anaerolineae bacterium]|nr:hypothetical protein [Anaerolineae bacterium]
MSKLFLLRPARVRWLINLTLVGLVLAACGSAAQPAAEATTEPAVEIEETADSPADTPATAAKMEKEPETVSEETTKEETSTSSKAECQPVNPKEDPVAGVTEYIGNYIDANATNEAIAAVSASDWVKGPTDAPITLIEYGDFQ